MCHVTASNKNIQFSKTPGEARRRRGEVKIVCVCICACVNQNVLNFLIGKVYTLTHTLYIYTPTYNLYFYIFKVSNIIDDKGSSYK